MAVYDTTNYIDTQALRKSKLTKNFASDNYWIDSLQNKVNAAWRFATNVVDIKEQQDDFAYEKIIKAQSKYSVIEVRINSAYDEKGQKLGNDYKNLIFKDVNHPLRLGRKYRFNYDDFLTGNEGESTWLGINYDAVQLGANMIVRRCSGLLGFLVNNNTEEWYEPAILDFDPKYTINYYNDFVNSVKSELYVIVQYNEYTKNIKINDRFILGALDFEDISNNNVYKVKELFRFGAIQTEEPNSCPLLTLALDRDVINPEMDKVTKQGDQITFIADYYNLKNEKDNNQSGDSEKFLKISPNVEQIYQGETQTFECHLYIDGEISDAKVSFDVDLPTAANPSRYYEIIETTDNSITIKNKYKFLRNSLRIKCSVDPEYEVEDLIFNIALEASL